ncbi:MAG: hypothetical protein C4541_03795, partial [Candidatus Auribacter fodinae]
SALLDLLGKITPAETADLDSIIDTMVELSRPAVVQTPEVLRPAQPGIPSLTSPNLKSAVLDTVPVSVPDLADKIQSMLNNGVQHIIVNGSVLLSNSSSFTVIDELRSGSFQGKPVNVAVEVVIDSQTFDFLLAMKSDTERFASWMKQGGAELMAQVARAEGRKTNQILSLAATILQESPETTLKRSADMRNVESLYSTAFHTAQSEAVTSPALQALAQWLIENGQLVFRSPVNNEVFIKTGRILTDLQLTDQQIADLLYKGKKGIEALEILQQDVREAFRAREAQDIINLFALLDQIIIEQTAGSSDMEQLAAQRQPMDSGTRGESEKPNLARASLEREGINIDVEIRKNIEAGNAIRFDLSFVTDRNLNSIEQIVNRLMEQDTGRLVEFFFNQRNVTFDGTSQEQLIKMVDAQNNLRKRLEDPATREAIRKALVLTLETLVQSHQDKTPGKEGYDFSKYNLTLLLEDEKGVFYTGEALAHAGMAVTKDRANIYVNLSSMAYLADKVDLDRAKYQKVLRSIFEHEYRDLERGFHVNDIPAAEFTDVKAFWKELRMNQLRDYFSRGNIPSANQALTVVGAAIDQVNGPVAVEYYNTYLRDLVESAVMDEVNGKKFSYYPVDGVTDVGFIQILNRLTQLGLIETTRDRNGKIQFNGPLGVMATPVQGAASVAAGIDSFIIYMNVDGLKVPVSQIVFDAVTQRLSDIKTAEEIGVTQSQALYNDILRKLRSGDNLPDLSSYWQAQPLIENLRNPDMSVSSASAKQLANTRALLLDYALYSQAPITFQDRKFDFDTARFATVTQTLTIVSKINDTHFIARTADGREVTVRAMSTPEVTAIQDVTLNRWDSNTILKSAFSIIDPAGFAVASQTLDADLIEAVDTEMNNFVNNFKVTDDGSVTVTPAGITIPKRVMELLLIAARYGNQDYMQDVAQWFMDEAQALRDNLVQEVYAKERMDFVQSVIDRRQALIDQYGLQDKDMGATPPIQVWAETKRDEAIKNITAQAQAQYTNMALAARTITEHFNIDLADTIARLETLAWLNENFTPKTGFSLIRNEGMFRGINPAFLDEFGYFEYAMRAREIRDDISAAIYQDAREQYRPELEREADRISTHFLSNEILKQLRQIPAPLVEAMPRKDVSIGISTDNRFSEEIRLVLGLANSNSVFLTPQISTRRAAQTFIHEVIGHMMLNRILDNAINTDNFDELNKLITPNDILTILDYAILADLSAARFSADVTPAVGTAIAAIAAEYNKNKPVELQVVLSNNNRTITNMSFDFLQYLIQNGQEKAFWQLVQQNIYVATPSNVQIQAGKKVDNYYTSIKEIIAYAVADQESKVMAATTSASSNYQNNPIFNYNYHDDVRNVLAGSLLQGYLFTKEGIWTKDQYTKVLDLDLAGNVGATDVYDIAADNAEEGDINVANIGTGSHQEANRMLARLLQEEARLQGREGLDALPDHTNKFGENFYILPGLQEYEQNGHAGIQRNALYADKASTAAHELVELRLWRQFGETVLGYTPEQINNGAVRIWIREMMARGEEEKALVEELNDIFHALGQEAEQFALTEKLDDQPVNEALFTDISDIATASMDETIFYSALAHLQYTALFKGAILPIKAMVVAEVLNDNSLELMASGIVHILDSRAMANIMDRSDGIELYNKVVSAIANDLNTDAQTILLDKLEDRQLGYLPVAIRLRELLGETAQEIDLTDTEVTQTDINIADIGTAIMDTQDTQVQSVIPIFLSPREEHFFLINDMAELQRLRRSSPIKDSVYADTASNAAFELTSMRLWRQFAAEVLGVKTDQIEDNLSLAVFNAMSDYIGWPQIVNNLVDSFNEIASKSKENALFMDDFQMNDLLFDDISAMVDRILVDNAAQINLIFATQGAIINGSIPTAPIDNIAALLNTARTAEKRQAIIDMMMSPETFNALLAQDETVLHSVYDRIFNQLNESAAVLWNNPKLVELRRLYVENALANDLDVTIIEEVTRGEEVVEMILSSGKVKSKIDDNHYLIQDSDGNQTVLRILMPGEINLIDNILEGQWRANVDLRTTYSTVDTAAGFAVSRTAMTPEEIEDFSTKIGMLSHFLELKDPNTLTYSVLNVGFPKKTFDVGIELALARTDSERKNLQLLIQAQIINLINEQGKKLLDDYAQMRMDYITAVKQQPNPQNIPPMRMWIDNGRYNAVWNTVQKADDVIQGMEMFIYMMQTTLDIELEETTELLSAMRWVFTNFDTNVGFNVVRNEGMLRAMLNTNFLYTTGYLDLILEAWRFSEQYPELGNALKFAFYTDIRDDIKNLDLFTRILDQLRSMPVDVLQVIPEGKNLISLADDNRGNKDHPFVMGLGNPEQSFMSSQYNVDQLTKTFIHEYIGHTVFLRYLTQAVAQKKYDDLEAVFPMQDILDIMVASTREDKRDEVRFKAHMTAFDVTDYLKVTTEYNNNRPAELHVDFNMPDPSDMTKRNIENVSIDFLTYLVDNNQQEIFWKLINQNLFVATPADYSIPADKKEDDYYTSIKEIIAYAAADQEDHVVNNATHAYAEYFQNPYFNYSYHNGVRDILSRNYLKGWYYDGSTLSWFQLLKLEDGLEIDLYFDDAIAVADTYEELALAAQRDDMDEITQEIVFPDTFLTFDMDIEEDTAIVRLPGIETTDEEITQVTKRPDFGDSGTGGTGAVVPVADITKTQLIQRAQQTGSAVYSPGFLNEQGQDQRIILIENALASNRPLTLTETMAVAGISAGTVLVGVRVLEKTADNHYVVADGKGNRYTLRVMDTAELAMINTVLDGSWRAVDTLRTTFSLIDTTSGFALAKTEMNAEQISNLNSAMQDVSAAFKLNPNGSIAITGTELSVPKSVITAASQAALSTSLENQAGLLQQVRNQVVSVINTLTERLRAAFDQQRMDFVESAKELAQKRNVPPLQIWLEDGQQQAITDIVAQAVTGIQQIENAVEILNKQFGMDFKAAADIVTALKWVFTNFNNDIGINAIQNEAMMRAMLNTDFLNKNGYLDLIVEAANLSSIHPEVSKTLGITLYTDIRDGNQNLDSFRVVLNAIKAMPKEIFERLPMDVSRVTMARKDDGLFQGMANEEMIRLSSAVDTMGLPTLLTHEYIGHHMFQHYLINAIHVNKDFSELESIIPMHDIVDILIAAVKADKRDVARITVETQPHYLQFFGPEIANLKKAVEAYNAGVAESQKIQVSAHPESAQAPIFKNISFDFLNHLIQTGNSESFWLMAVLDMYIATPSDVRVPAGYQIDTYYTSLQEIIAHSAADQGAQVAASISSSTSLVRNPVLNYRFADEVKKILARNLLSGWVFDRQTNQWSKLEELRAPEQIIIGTEEELAIAAQRLSLDKRAAEFEFPDTFLSIGLNPVDLTKRVAVTDEGDIDISSLGRGSHRLANAAFKARLMQKAQQQGRTGFDALPDFTNERGEQFYFLTGLENFEQAGHAGLRRNSVYTNNAVTAAHELAELRLWRQFASEVLGMTEQQIAEGQLRDWIRSNLEQGGIKRDIVLLIDRRLHQVGTVAEQVMEEESKKLESTEPYLPSGEVNKAVFDELSRIADLVIQSKLMKDQVSELFTVIKDVLDNELPYPEAVLQNLLAPVFAEIATAGQVSAEQQEALGSFILDEMDR